jgi:hypothetical protein
MDIIYIVGFVITFSLIMFLYVDEIDNPIIDFITIISLSLLWFLTVPMALLFIGCELLGELLNG